VYSADLKDDYIFVFGNEIGSGEDYNPVHLGFKTRKMIKRIVDFKNRGSYHIDAIYKIVKYT
jgi:hypothetical protein